MIGLLGRLVDQRHGRSADLPTVACTIAVGKEEPARTNLREQRCVLLFRLEADSASSSLLVVVNRVQIGKLTLAQNPADEQAVRQPTKEHDVTRVLNTPKAGAHTLAASADGPPSTSH